MIKPGQTIGFLGGAPMGRMLARAAETLGYRIQVFDPEGRGAGQGFRGSFDDSAALREFARGVELIVCVSENIPADPLSAIAPLVPLFPRVEVVHVCQNRQREKAWLRTHGFPHVRYAEALDGDIAAVIAQVGRPCVVKAADFSHDGGGQMKIADDGDLERAAAIFRGRRCVLERWIDFSCELVVIVARTLDGAVRTFPLAETIHARNVLDISVAPARVSDAIAREAMQLATTITEKLGVVGLLAVEMFVTPSGDVLVNELVPRPHNGGHWTIEGCETSQFEQHVRAVCGLPLGSVGIREPTVMVNILGDAWRWQQGRVTGEPDWAAVLNHPRAKLHVYDEAEPRPGRKMGHFTVRSASIEAAMEQARDLKQQLNANLY